MYFKGIIKNNEIKEIQEINPPHPGDVTSSTREKGGKVIYDYVIVEAENSEKAIEKINQIIKDEISN